MQLSNHTKKLSLLWHQFVQEVHSSFSTALDTHNFLVDVDRKPAKAAKLFSVLCDKEVRERELGILRTTTMI